VVVQCGETGENKKFYVNSFSPKSPIDPNHPDLFPPNRPFSTRETLIAPSVFINRPCQNETIPFK